MELVMMLAASEAAQKLVAKKTSFSARAMQFAMWRQISGNGEMMVKGMTPQLPMREGDVTPIIGFFSRVQRTS